MKEGGGEGEEEEMARRRRRRKKKKEREVPDDGKNPRSGKLELPCLNWKRGDNVQVEALKFRSELDISVNDMAKWRNYFGRFSLPTKTRNNAWIFCLE
jgi:hypothetical protein